MHNNKQKGFTLVELLVVIAIIGLLSTIAVVSLGSARAKARDATRIADMKQTATALEQFYADKGGYPSAAAVGSLTVPSATNDIVLGGTNTKSLTSLMTTAAGTATGAFGQASNTTGNTVYMASVPVYPTPGKAAAATDCSVFGAAFCYAADTAFATNPLSTNYAMFWQLEATNPNAGFNGTSCTTTNSGTTCV